MKLKAANGTYVLFPNLLGDIFGFVVFLCMMPFFVWNREWLIVFFSTLVFFLALPRIISGRLNTKTLSVFACFFVFFVAIAIPFREYDGWSMKYVLNLFLVFIGLFFLKDSIYRSWAVLRSIFVFVSLVTMFSQVFFALGLPFPSVMIPQDFRPQDSDVYRLYYGIVWLSTEVFSVAGLPIMRNSGWFGEPGHFGIYICLILLLEKRPLIGWKNKILGIAIFSTFSSAAILIYFLIVSIKERMLFLGLFSILCFFVVSVFDDIYNMIMGKIVGVDGVLSSRATLNVNFSDMSFFDVFFGRGRNYLSSIGETSSNYDAFLVQYGFFSVFIFLILFVSVLKASWSAGKMTVFCYFVVGLMIFAHRYWMVDTFYFWFPSIVLMSLAMRVKKQQ